MTLDIWIHKSYFEKNCNFIYKKVVELFIPHCNHENYNLDWGRMKNLFTIEKIF
jgi:hypothetical protein